MDRGLGEDVVVLKVPGLPGNRLVFASTGPVNRDYDDIRRFSDAAINGIKRSGVGGRLLSASLPFQILTFCFPRFQGLEGWNAAAAAGLPATQGL